MFANDLLLYFLDSVLSLTSPALELIRDQMQGPAVSSPVGATPLPPASTCASTSLIALCFLLPEAVTSSGFSLPGDLCHQLGSFLSLPKKAQNWGLLRQLEEAFGEQVRA